MICRTLERGSGLTGRTFQTPILWLGQNLRNRILLAHHRELRSAPLIVSLGDAFQRPSFHDRFFTEQLRENLNMDGPIMVDSGGYALLARRSLRCSIRQISKIYERLDADILVSLDHPPSPGDDRVVRSRLRRRTLHNLDLLRHTVAPERLMPVVHGHTLSEIERSCEDIRRLCPDARQVGVGGLVPLLQSGGAFRGFRYNRSDGTSGDRGTWIADTLSVLRQYFPQALIHVFGIGSATTAIGALALGADSADSLSWRRVANYGAILLPGRSERFPVYRKHRVPSRPVLTEEDIPLLLSCRCPVCTSFPQLEKRLQALSSCYKRRAIHNAWTLLSEVASFRAAIQRCNVPEFLESRLTARHLLYKPVMATIHSSSSSLQ